MKLIISDGLISYRGENHLLWIGLDFKNGSRKTLLDISKPKWLMRYQDDLDGRYGNRGVKLYFKGDRKITGTLILCDAAICTAVETKKSCYLPDNYRELYLEKKYPHLVEIWAKVKPQLKKCYGYCYSKSYEEEDLLQLMLHEEEWLDITKQSPWLSKLDLRGL